jgi:glycosyltransferase involved in cell wall biosynthesis
MTNQTLITIGIPAYNEEGNIKQLLESLLNQRILGFSIEIIVISDKSSDKTVKEAASVNDPRVRVIELKEREGKNAVLNRLIRLSRGEVLILMDADVIPTDPSFVAQLANAVLSKKISLVAGRVESVPPQAIFEKISSWGQEYRETIFFYLNPTDSVYHCYGRALALSKSFYKKVVFPMDVPDDAYLYFFCKANGYNFSVAQKAKVYFRATSSLFAQKKQSDRFVSGKKRLEKLFGQKTIKTAYAIPLKIGLTAGLKILSKKTIPTLVFGSLYLGFQAYRLTVGNRLTNEDKFSKQGQFETLQDTKTIKL